MIEKFSGKVEKVENVRIIEILINYMKMSAFSFIFIAIAEKKASIF